MYNYFVDDFKRFCMNCSWLDPDLGCCSPPGEDVYQCDMYRFYHPDEVIQFEKDMFEWANQNK